MWVQTGQTTWMFRLEGWDWLVQLCGIFFEEKTFVGFLDDFHSGKNFKVATDTLASHDTNKAMLKIKFLFCYFLNEITSMDNLGPKVFST